MSVIKGKNKEEVIKTLKRLGEVVVIAKAEVIYAFKKGFFPNQTIEEVMECIKKSPKGYKYYQIGDITITEISESKEETKETEAEKDWYKGGVSSPYWKALKEDSRGEKIPIEPDLLERIMKVKAVPMEKKAYKPNSIMDALFDINGNVKKEKDCNECDLYGECDHQGAYQKDGKWCYETLGGEKEDISSYYLPNGYADSKPSELIPDPLKSIAKIDKEMEETNWAEIGKKHKCEGCDLVAYDQRDKNIMVCLHESFRPQAPFITKDFICPKDLIVCRMGTGSMKDQKEFEEKGKWGDKKEKKD